MAVSKRTRFEVLRRDNHTCRYCGQSAPDVKLTVDHVLPVALGGHDDLTNLVAACKDCNSGKSSMSPGAPLVEDVRLASLVWDAAISMAIERAADRRDVQEQLFDYFENEWTYRHGSWAPDLPYDWRGNVANYYARGLRVADFDEAIDIALLRPGLSHRDRWSYFCGICKNKIREIEDEAREIIAEHGIRI